MFNQTYKYFQVSAEPDGATYVFQGFIQGKDYGQFGLQRLGNVVIFIFMYFITQDIIRKYNGFCTLGTLTAF